MRHVLPSSTARWAKAESGNGLSTKAVLFQGFAVASLDMCQCSGKSSMWPRQSCAPWGNHPQSPAGMSQLAAFPVWALGEKAWQAQVWPASFLALVLSFRTRSCLLHVLPLSVQQNKTKPSSGLVPPYLEPCPGLREPCSV